MEENGIKTARDLRVRIVREVAQLEVQAKFILEEAEKMQKELDLMEQEFLGCISKIESKIGSMVLAELIDDVESAKKEYHELAEEFIDKKNSKISAIAIANSRAKEWSSKAYGALKAIVDDIIAGAYGRGEISLSHSGCVRIFGKIKELNENHYCCCLFLLGARAQFSGDDMKKVVKACVEGQPPLFQISMKLMPFNKEEAIKICWENENYELVRKHVPPDLFTWNTKRYQIMKSDSSELFLTSIGEDKTAVIKMDILDYPKRRLTLLGKMKNGNEDAIFALSYWNGKKDSPVELEDAYLDCGLLLSNFAWHLGQKFPGLIFECPQISKVFDQ